MPLLKMDTDGVGLSLVLVVLFWRPGSRTVEAGNGVDGDIDDVAPQSGNGHQSKVEVVEERGAVICCRGE
jgi:hypothetical protein